VWSEQVSVDVCVPCYGEREQAPLHVAAAQGHHETVFTLLDQCGADVNIRDSEGETPLHSAVVSEYDPLGMKSKDDYTETAKILLNFGAEVNVRNARGETALHLAARNEFQKIVEILVLAGCDPSIEDNDKNKSIDLVAEEDAVSRQILKNALADRDRLLMEAREIRAKGFSTSLQRELPLSMRSQSTMNVPLLAGMQSAAAASRYTSHTGLFQPNLSMQYAPAYGGGGMSAGAGNLSLGYIPGAVGMAHYAGGGGNNNSGSRTGSSSNGSLNQHQLQPQPRLPLSMMQGSSSTAALIEQPPTGLSIAALRKTRSVEELDQPRSKKDGSKAAGGRRTRRVRKSSYQESETSSFWAVTPPGSIHDGDDDNRELDVEVPPVRGAKQPAASKKQTKAMKMKTRLVEDDEERENVPEVRKKQPQQPLQFVSAKKAAAMQAAEDDGHESDDYFLDDDSSVDMLDDDDDDVPRKKKDKKKKSAEVADRSGPQQRPVAATRQTAPAKGEPATKKKAVESWLDEQARILKEKNRGDASTGPVAHSTPPASKKNKNVTGGGKKKKKKKKGSDDDEDSESTESSSTETETTESDSDSSSTAPKGPPPPPPTKPKPQPPPKPSSKDGPSGKTTLSSGPAPSQRKMGSGTSRHQPLFQMEQPGIDRIIQLDVDESTETGETVISIIPLQPPGPTRVQKVPSGVEASTYVSLSRSGTPTAAVEEAPSTKSKSKKSATPTPGGKTSKQARDADEDGGRGTGEAPRPVPKPRESKMPAATSGAGGRKYSDPTVAQTSKSKKAAASDESTDFSDVDHEEAAALAAVAAAAAAAKSKSSARSTPNLAKPQPSAGDRASPFTKPQPIKPAPQQQQQPAPRPGTIAAAKLIFEKAGGDSTTDGDRSISFHDVSTSSTAGVAAQGTKMTAAAAMTQQPVIHPRRTSAHEMTSSSAASNLLNTSTGAPPSKPVSATGQAKSAKQKTAKMPKHEQDSDESESGSDDSDDTDDSGQRSDDIRTVTYRGDGQSIGFTLVGGNVKGVFVDAVDMTSDPARAGLLNGDHLLCVDGRPTMGRTREEVMQWVRTSITAAAEGKQEATSLLVRYRPNQTRKVAEADSGAGDDFIVRAHFAYDATRRGELTVHEGDVFAVSDTLPEGSAGFWRARKIDLAGRKDGDSSAIGNGLTSQEGLIPNRAKADQIVLRHALAQGKPGQNQRGAAFFRSFRRSKSVGRLGGLEEDDTAGDGASTGNVQDVVSYERVVQKITDYRRPVVVLGLFCDTVRGMLVGDESGKFVVPTEEVETPVKDAGQGGSGMRVDVRPIAAVPPHQHCVLILTPPGIEFLQQRTDLNPIVIYISPVSKNVVKVVKSKLAPTYNKNPGFMYDEAARFEKNYAHLFSAVVPYTMDDTWYRNLRDAVEYLQNQPTWVGVSPAELEAANTAEAEKILPAHVLKSAAATPAVVRGTGKTAISSSKTRPISRTTDDIPNEYNSDQLTGAGAAGLMGSTGGTRYTAANFAPQKSVDAGTSGRERQPDDEEDGSTGGTLKSVGRTGPGRTDGAVTGAVPSPRQMADKSSKATAAPATISAAPVKARTQSTSSTLDRQPLQQQSSLAGVPVISGVVARSRMIAASQVRT
jgi:hypothetical protein